MRIKTQFNKLAAVILPVVQTVNVLLFVAAVDNERCVSAAQKLLEHYQPADHAVVFAEPKRKYPANAEAPNEYTSYHLYVSDDLINEIVTIGKESLKGLMPYKT